jgi:hypothetical protein
MLTQNFEQSRFVDSQSATSNCEITAAVFN